MRIHREEVAEYYAKQEEEDIENGEIDLIIIEEYRCEICNKTFKKEATLNNHL